uniref:Uncharacterized protein n=1 Tax=Cacopsylla melanoneura TaxID=428564 RepID=A0A8D8XQS6_9HEMI
MDSNLGWIASLVWFLVWGCSSEPAPQYAPHMGETTTPTTEDDSPWGEELTHSQAKKYNGTWCPAMTPQRSFDIDQLTGIWHVVEIILHRENSKSNKPIKSPPIQIVSGCPSVHLNRNPDQKDIISLLWNEEAGFLEYRFQMTHLTDMGPGYWVSYGPQNGSLTQISDKSYTQFAGTVQVIKAVQSHMVLTFCSPKSQLYSAVLARTTPLVRSELRGIHTMLERRGLQNMAFTETCRALASKVLGSSLLMIIGVFVLTRLKS